MHQSGVFVPENGIYFGKFAQGDYEKAAQEANLPTLRSRRDPDLGMIETPPSLGVSRIFPTRGMANPFPNYPIPDHLHRA